jgi:hypothetical protein
MYINKKSYQRSIIKMMFKYLSLLFFANCVLAQNSCYGCLRVGSENEYIGGIQKACDGKTYSCNVFGANCDVCWTQYPEKITQWCESNKYTSGDKSYTYKVQRLGDFNCN